MKFVRVKGALDELPFRDNSLKELDTTNITAYSMLASALPAIDEAGFIDSLFRAGSHIPLIRSTVAAEDAFELPVVHDVCAMKVQFR